MKIRRRRFAANVPSTAMGDIAFNLLIFFVILARAQDDSHLQWKPASAAELESSGASKVSVLIDADNKYYVNGKQFGAAQLAGEIESMLGSARTTCSFNASPNSSYVPGDLVALSANSSMISPIRGT